MGKEESTRSGRILVNPEDRKFLELDVFSGICYNDVAPNVTDTWNFNIPFPGRRAQIISVAWDLRVEMVGNPGFVPLEVVDCLQYALVIGDGTFKLAMDFFTTAVPAGGAFVTGWRIEFYRPGQRLFNSFFARNILPVILTITNRDLVNTWTYNSSVIVETQMQL